MRLLYLGIETPKLNVTAGKNWSTHYRVSSLTDRFPGDFNVNYGVIGLRYSFQGFRQMIFANARLESSTTQDGLEIGNVYTIGVRWDLP